MRLVIGDRTPDMTYDPVDGRLFFLRDSREIGCYVF